MPEYDNRNTGVLFPNERKREGKRDPDLTGTWTDANNVEHWLSAWQNRDGRLNIKMGNRKEPRGTGGLSGYQQRGMDYGAPPPQSARSYGTTPPNNGGYPPPGNTPPPARNTQAVTCVDPRDGSHFQATYEDAMRNGWEIVNPAGGRY